MSKHQGSVAAWTWLTSIGLLFPVQRIFRGVERKAIDGNGAQELSTATKEQRRHVRHTVKLPATFANGRASGYAIIENVSHGGCKIRTRVAVTLGDSGSLLINLPGCHAPVTVSTALVRWVRGHLCGIEFIGLDPHDWGLLDQATTRLGARPFDTGITIH
jgi:hypothetical protein